MERDDLSGVAGFFLEGRPLTPGIAVLGEEAAHHARVRRLAVGDRAYIVDGAGARGVGSIAHLTKTSIEISIDDVRLMAQLPAVHLLVPIADRDRLTWCAEKCAELGATSWTPIMWNRSRSVSPRGEGAAFRERVRARMQSALIQSHGAWLPDVRDDASVEQAVAAAATGGTRLVLDAAGEAIGAAAPIAPVTIVIGPEGGIEDAELRILREASFRAVSLGANVLRFETAAIAALAIVRAALGASRENPNG